MTAADQSVIRARVLHARVARGRVAWQEASTAIADRFESLPEAAAAQIIATYASLDTEPDTWRMITSFHALGRTMLLPRVSGPRTLEWGRYDGPDSVIAGRWNILEPKEPTARSLSESEIVVVPAVAVDPIHGTRIGYGGGFFDVALADVAQYAEGGPLRVTFCCDDDVIAGIPANTWDVRVDVIVTPTRIIRP